MASSPVLCETAEHPEDSFLQIRILTPLRILDKHCRKNKFSTPDSVKPEQQKTEEETQTEISLTKIEMWIPG